jgi:hypothetical protein
MSTLSDLKKMRLDISQQVARISLISHDEDVKGQMLQELETRMNEIEAEIEELEREEKAAKEAKKLEKKNKKK